ncbi:MAG: MoxR family ATPase [Clostridiales bacterium]|jgi:MoxR-like ATPase|nr:MoxR family ATPase [Clostridiales bacterium]MDR2751517.1 MoxR family ATPase [Clostridiales bacterium]
MDNSVMSQAEAVRLMKAIAYNVERVIIGKRFAIELVINALSCRGHVLIEDVPGVGKTSLVSALAKSVDCTFKRIQFTPDIMPSDITGFSTFSLKTSDFEYKPGAVMSQFILADEINRTSPKTQSSLLEVMEENQVTVDGITYKVPKPFMVLATQNPVEYLGTYPLPEAQLDRFFMKVSLGYPNPAEESRMLARFKSGSPLADLTPVADGKAIESIQALTESVYVDRELQSYIVDIVRNTRQQEEVVLGASPRASLYLFRSSQAWALYQGRDFVVPDDITLMAPHVLGHRIMMRQEARMKKITPKDIIERALSSVSAPAL